ncbi:alpha/beta hydrolase [Nocardia brevicatena]|uniref:alpha/beta hydrolase n=1 Tax=Nocardia brevicatena TaxID=37327 RepID=UPI0002E64D43|nr:alpha/beta hydrolase [Nocardia brevicatena]
MPEQRVIDAVIDAYSFAGPDATLEQVRTGYDGSMEKAGLPEGVTREEGVLGSVPGAWLRPPGADGRVVLYLHGGGFQFGSSRSHAPLAGVLAIASGAEVFVLDYLRAPEHPFPAALDDATAALRALAEERGSDKVVPAGDSAGGSIVFGTLLAARAAGIGSLLGAVAFSPWVDLTQSGATIADRAERDPLVTREQLEANATAYLGDGDRSEPLASPLYGDLAALPPVLLQVGTEEILLDDTQRLAEKIRASGGRVEVQVEEGMPHVHQILLGRLPEALPSLQRAGAFIRSLG